jgi:hypothetical protein
LKIGTTCKKILKMHKAERGSILPLVFYGDFIYSAAAVHKKPSVPWPVMGLWIDRQLRASK